MAARASSVWLQLSYPGCKNLLIQAVYRQFQRLGEKGSIAPNFQLQRWKNIIEKWELAMTENKEIIPMGDYNLNYLRWEINQSSINYYDRQNKPSET